MADTTNVSLAKEFSGLPLEHLIGGPLIAAARANSMMAMEQAKFIMDYCFYQKEDGYHPIMISMTLTRSFIDTSDPAGTKTKDRNLPLKQLSTSFTLPLLTIIPISSLAVESMEVDFEMEVKAQHTVDSQRVTDYQSKSSDTPDNSGNMDSISQGQREAVLKGVISSDSQQKKSTDTKDHYDRSNSARLSINVKAGNLPLPIGLTTLLEVFSKSINPTNTKE